MASMALTTFLGRRLGGDDEGLLCFVLSRSSLCRFSPRDAREKCLDVTNGGPLRRPGFGGDTERKKKKKRRRGGVCV